MRCRGRISSWVPDVQVHLSGAIHVEILQRHGNGGEALPARRVAREVQHDADRHLRRRRRRRLRCHCRHSGRSPEHERGEESRGREQTS